MKWKVHKKGLNEVSKDDCWKEEYELYIAHGEVDKAKEILLNVIPKDKMIYKYFRGIDRDYNTFTKPGIWLCNTYYLNDSFDCAFLMENYTN